MKRIRIVNVTGLRNLGVHALVASTVNIIQRIDRDAQIEIVSGTPNYDRLVTDGDGPYAFFLDVGQSSEASLKSRLVFNIGVKLKVAGLAMRHFQHLSPVDLTIVSGGDMFGEEYGEDGLWYGCKTIEAAARRSKAVVMIGQSFGKIRSKIGLESFRQCLGSVDRIGVREEVSLSWLTQNFPEVKERAELVADSAFELEAYDYSGRPIDAGQAGYAEGGPVVVCPSGGIAAFSAVDRNAHLDAWCRLITEIAEGWGREVWILPHVAEVNPFNDDTIVARKVSQRLACKGVNARLLPFVGDSRIAKGVITRASAVVTERTHVAIAGFSQCVPVASIGYSVKATGIARLCYGDKADIHCIPIGEFCEGNFSVFTERFFNSLRESREALLTQNAFIKELSRKNMQMISRFLA